MSRVDLDRNRSVLQEAFEEVSNPKNETNWALFGYEGQTSALKVVGKGDGGIEEMVDDLSSGKIMYAYCRVRDPNTDLPKFVLINWQGEGVPEILKGSCASHLTDINKFLKGAHVTITARTEDDVDEADILDKVSKSSGSNYSFHKEKAKPGMNAPAGPVGSVYQKVKPHQELKSEVRDQFWQEQQEEEKRRQEVLQQKAMEEKQKQDREVKEREMREAQERESRERERMKKVHEQRLAEKRASASDDSEKKAEWELTQVEAIRDEEERKRRADNLRKERANEAQSLVQQRKNDPRALFEQKPASQFDVPTKAPPPPRKIKHGVFGEEPPSQFDAPKKPIHLPKEEPQASSMPPQRQLPPVPRNEPESAPAQPPPKMPPVSAVTSDHPPTRNILAEGLPPRQDSDEEQEDQDWDAGAQNKEPSGEDFSIPKTELLRTSYPEPEDVYDDVQATEQPEELYDDVQATEQPEELYDDVRQDAQEELYDDIQQTGGNVQFTPEQGVCARALYDYQATEDNEVTFDPGDIITNIDQVDPGWWVGITPDGSQGMFPSNYVELLN